MDLTAIQQKIRQIPRLPVATVPTPLHFLAKLSARFDNQPIYIKRDDLSGLALGGNKARKLDFIMADVKNQGATSIITWGGIQSNWCRQVAAAARMFDVKPVLILFATKDQISIPNGNHLLDILLDADIDVVAVDENRKIFRLEDIKDIIKDRYAREIASGQIPYIAPLGGSMTEGSMTAPLGAVSYFDVFIEALLQMREYKATPDAVVLACGSGSTQAGLLVAAKLLSPHTRVIGIGVTLDHQSMVDMVESIATDLISYLKLPISLAPRDIVILDNYQMAGYGVLTPQITETIHVMARTEGILLDPVYTGKAMMGLEDLLSQGFFNKDDTILFMHTGGNPALFHYGEGLLSHISNRKN